MVDIAVLRRAELWLGNLGFRGSSNA